MPSRDSANVERVIPAPPEAIFELLADPRRHPDIDGSGTVKGQIEGPERLELGSTFGMDMKMGMRYSMRSTVVEFDEGRLIAWQSRPTSGLGAKVAGGRIWRYELEPAEGGTLVRETWDISQEKVKALVQPARKRTITAMKATLARIEELVTGA